jgi:prepilin-type N-terminal cleavage/methylation domain-containing protein
VTGSLTIAPRRRGGFTLLELVLVAALLAIFAAVTVPRFVGNQSRLAAAEVEAVRSLVSAVAMRDALGHEPIALAFDGAAGELRAEVRRADAAGTVAWRADPLLEPVRLSRTQVTAASIGGERQAARGWRLVLAQDGPRPAVELTLARRDNAAEVWAVALPPGASEARTFAGAAVPGGVAAVGAIDLDAAGRGNQPW